MKMDKKTIRSYRDLIVWQKAIALVTAIYTMTKKFPRDEIYGLSMQIRRCAVSIPSNIAEGYGRNATKDYLRFLHIAIGSLYELQTQEQIAFNLNYFDKETYTRIDESSREIERMLSSLIRKIDEAS
jgi:four helix bundle protein